MTIFTSASFKASSEGVIFSQSTGLKIIALIPSSIISWICEACISGSVFGSFTINSQFFPSNSSLIALSSVRKYGFSISIPENPIFQLSCSSLSFSSVFSSLEAALSSGVPTFFLHAVNVRAHSSINDNIRNARFFFISVLSSLCSIMLYFDYSLQFTKACEL